jgi:chitinase
VSSQKESKKKLIVYHTNWATYDRAFQVHHLPLEHGLTDINYAFLNLTRDPASEHWIPVLSDPWADTEKPYPGLESSPLKGNLGLFDLLRRQGQSFNLGMSIGGWTYSAHFSDAVASPQAREVFVQGILRLLDQFPIFTRVDLYVDPYQTGFYLILTYRSKETGNTSHPRERTMGTLEM